MEKSKLFNEDLALDVRDRVMEDCRKRLEDGLSVRDCERSELSWIMAYVEILYSIAAFCGNNEFTIAEVQSWRDRALFVFDSDDRKGGDNVKVWRQQIIEAFNRLETVAKSTG